MSTSNTLIDANRITQEYVDRLYEVIGDYVFYNLEFYKSGLSKFTLGIIPDAEESFYKKETDFGTLIPLSLFDTNVNDILDVLSFYMHIMTDKECEGLWKKCPVPHCFFTYHEVTFIEDMYAQRIMDMVAPKCFDVYIGHMRRHTEIMGLGSSTLHQHMDSLYTRVPDVGVPPAARLIHAWLYESDPHSQVTFNRFVSAWQSLLSTSFRRIFFGYAYPGYAYT